MIISLANDIRITNDKHCWKLERKRTRNGEETYQAFKWCTSLRQAIDSACEYEVGRQPTRTLSEAAATISRITARYECLFDCAHAKVPARAGTRLRAVS